MGQTQFKATDAALSKTIQVTQGAGESLVKTQVESFRDPVWRYGTAFVGVLVICSLISFLVYGITAYNCEKKPKSKRKKCKTRGGGWGTIFLVLALVFYLIVWVIHRVRNPYASAQLLGMRAIKNAF